MEILQFSFPYKRLTAHSELSHEDQTLLKYAIDATKNAYAPYSNFSVGVALELANKEIITGSNQENAAYPSGLCAERVAMNYASHSFPGIAINVMVITAFTNRKMIGKPVPPCGACRQVIAEYVNRTKTSFRIILTGQEECIIIDDVMHLLPFYFTKHFLD